MSSSAERPALDGGPNTRTVDDVVAIDDLMDPTGIGQTRAVEHLQTVERKCHGVGTTDRIRDQKFWCLAEVCILADTPALAMRATISMSAFLQSSSPADVSSLPRRKPLSLRPKTTSGSWPRSVPPAQSLSSTFWCARLSSFQWKVSDIRQAQILSKQH